MRKFQQLKTVAAVPTPKGTLVLQDYYPSKPNNKKWREYVLYCAGVVGGKGLVFATEDARMKWVAQQRVSMVQQPLAW
jgi:hypothetical protein